MLNKLYQHFEAAPQELKDAVKDKSILKNKMTKYRVGQEIAEKLLQKKKEKLLKRYERTGNPNGMTANAVRHYHS